MKRDVQRKLVSEDLTTLECNIPILGDEKYQVLLTFNKLVQIIDTMFANTLTSLW